LEPFLARLTGLGPVWEPPFSPARGWSRRPPATIRSPRHLVTRQAAVRAAAPTRPPAATQPSAGSRSSRRRSRAQSADSATRSPCATRTTRSPAAHTHPAAASRPDSENALSFGTAARSAPTLIRHDPRLRGHRHPLDLDNGCRRRSSSANGSPHFGSSSKSGAHLMRHLTWRSRPVTSVARPPWRSDSSGPQDDYDRSHFDASGRRRRWALGLPAAYGGEGVGVCRRRVTRRPPLQLSSHTMHAIFNDYKKDTNTEDRAS